MDKISEVVRVVGMVDTFNCESPHVSHIPHFEALVDLCLS